MCKRWVMHSDFKVNDIWTCLEVDQGTYSHSGFQLRVHSLTPHPIGAWLDCPNIEFDLAVGQISRPREITQMQLKRCADVNP